MTLVACGSCFIFYLPRAPAAPGTEDVLVFFPHWRKYDLVLVLGQIFIDLVHGKIAAESKTQPKEPTLFWQTVTLYKVIKFLFCLKGSKEIAGLKS